MSIDPTAEYAKQGYRLYKLLLVTVPRQELFWLASHLFKARHHLLTESGHDELVAYAYGGRTMNKELKSRGSYEFSRDQLRAMGFDIHDGQSQVEGTFTVEDGGVTVNLQAGEAPHLAHDEMID